MVCHKFLNLSYKWLVFTCWRTLETNIYDVLYFDSILSFFLLEGWSSFLATKALMLLLLKFLYLPKRTYWLYIFFINREDDLDFIYKIINLTSTIEAVFQGRFLTYLSFFIMTYNMCEQWIKWIRYVNHRYLF